ncbi:MAG: Low-molecular weight cobalt-containing nitrile hydratase subunit alpha [Hyphomicrobiales bacterium]|nr:Low-molecular weight cobalt-containing nitrile hydratase subunit alpha [Hyphomicrobiales bacterium]
MPHDHHDHDHPAHSPPQPDDKVHSYYQILGVALKELLIEKGIVTADEVRSAIEKRDQITPAHGAAVVARAWSDAGFRTRLLTDANAAVAELGYPMTTTRLVAVENTADVHNVVVCTLCSCYPRELLGLPPAWYKSRAYRARIVHEPRAVLAEFGTQLLEETEVRVHDSTADMRFLVVPRRPAGTESLDEAALAELVSRDSMIGVAVVRQP